MSQNVFYAWQSDSENRLNRSFIERALQAAIDAILDADLALEPVIDRDTLGLPGAPNIVEAILAKIDCAAVVVADVSIINIARSEIAPVRLTPNPNVMFELGYAAAKLGWEYIIPVLNLATGQIEELPFDIRQRRPVTYTAPIGADDLASERRELQRKLQRALITCLGESQSREARVRIVFNPRPGRFGLSNSGARRVRVDKLVYRFPQTIHVNSGSPYTSLPAIRTRDFGYIDGIQWWEMTLFHLPGAPPDQTLPDYIAPGDTEVFMAMPAYIKDNSPRATTVYLKYYLDDGTFIEKNPTVGELFDPQGPYTP